MFSENETPRWGMPWLYAGQAQKEITHNEALAQIDALLHPGVVSAGQDAPPETPTPGECHLVGPAPTGDWAGRANALAFWTGGGWRFAAPTEGMAVWLVSEGVQQRFVDGSWQAVPPFVSAPTGGATIDAEARAALVALIAAMRQHGLLTRA